jgi:hypothetical protein
MGKTRKGSEETAVELCKSGDFVNAIAELVAAREHVTFVEMDRYYPRGWRRKGMFASPLNIRLYCFG